MTRTARQWALAAAALAASAAACSGGKSDPDPPPPQPVLSAIEFVKCSLVVAAGPDAGARVPFESSRATIGTSPDCTLLLSDPTVSRVHCELVVEDRGFRLHDLDSTNGTTVAGLLVREVWLEAGASFSVGSTRISLEPSAQRVEIRLSDEDRFGFAIGASARMREIFYVLERMAPKDVTVLLTGETGTGKDVLARSIHERSPRREKPFVTVDCGSLPDELVESELFGHAKGAFTGATEERAGAFEAADGGTVFLDEIGELPLAQQTKLLRVLEEREIRRVGETKPRKVDVRVIAATNRSLPVEVQAGTFRKDLYFRLSVLELRVPPLRERIEDIPLLAEQFLASLAERGGRAKPALARHAIWALKTYPWPGNVRELRNVLEKAVALAAGPEIGPEAIALGSMGDDPSSTRPARPFAVDARVPYDEAHDRFEREYLMDLLRLHELNVTNAAKAAGIHRQTIHRLLRKHGIKLDEYRD